MRSRIGWLVAAVATAGLARAITRLDAVRVDGESMAPTLHAGELLAVRPLRAGDPREGQIVVARSGAREVVKRVVTPRHPIDPTMVWLEGDNPDRSTDSRTTGPVRRDAVVGIVRARYWPPRRARLF